MPRLCPIHVFTQRWEVPIREMITLCLLNASSVASFDLIFVISFALWTPSWVGSDQNQGRKPDSALLEGLNVKLQADQGQFQVTGRCRS